jgi:hypothetical protein
MSTLEGQYIADTYTGVLHTDGSINPTGQKDVYDGLGNKTPIKIGRDGNGVTISSPFKVGELQYPATNSEIGSLMSQTSDGLLELVPIKNALYDAIFPIGGIYLSISNTNPSSFFPGTVWRQVANGRFLVGVGMGSDGATSRSFSPGPNSGSYAHSLNVNEMPEHTHEPVNPDGSDDFPRYKFIVTFSSSGQINRQEAGREDNRSYSFPNDRPVGKILSKVGKGVAHNNTPPGFGVYVWERIS